MGAAYQFGAYQFGAYQIGRKVAGTLYQDDLDTWGFYVHTPLTVIFTKLAN